MLHVVAFYLLLTGACGYAVLRGGAPERWVAAILLAGTVATWAIVIAPRGYAGMFRTTEPVVAAIDGTMLLCIVVIALTADRFWPLCLAALQAFGVIGHLAKTIAPEILRDVYLTAHAFSAYPGLLLLILATRRHRRRQQLTSCDPSWSTCWRSSTATMRVRVPIG